jgi:hypothetical protein
MVAARGRPKMAKQVRKADILAVRVSPGEKEEIAQAAQKVGASGASAWVRMLALKEARKVNREGGE